MAAAQGQAPLSLVLLLLAAAPAEWTVVHTTSSSTDYGNGKIVATSDVTVTITPTQVQITTEGSDHDKPYVNKGKPTPLDPEVRDAIAALLPKLPDKHGSYSISDSVNDEGDYSETLGFTRAGKTVNFNLLQGKQNPRLPPELAELERLVARAQRPAKK